MDDLFEGLNDVPWVDLQIESGSAEEVPMWTRQLASEDEDLRVGASFRLASELAPYPHAPQLSLYSASAAAIPFLTELLREREAKGKADVLRVLEDIANAAAASADDRHGADAVLLGPGALASSAVLAHVQDALRSGLQIYVGLLSDDSVEIRMRAADLVSLCDSGRGLDQPLHAAFGRETDEVARANLVLALARLAPITEKETTLFRSILHSLGESGLYRTVAALALVQSHPTEAPSDALEWLAAALGREAEILGAVYDLPCSHENPVWVIRSALCQVIPERLRFLLPTLLEAVAEAHEEQATCLVDVVTHIVFEGQEWSQTETRAAGSLTGEQREALEKIVLSPGAWEWGNWHALHRYGLPTDRESLASHLEVTLPADNPGREPAESAFDAAVGRFQEAGDRILDEVASDPAIDDIRMIGWRSESQNNVVMTINDAIIIRFPKHTRAIDEMERELRLLRALQGKLPLPIPKPIYSSLEPREVGHAFMGYEKLPGKPLYREMLESVPGEQTVQRLAEQLGGFLRALHTLPVAETFDFELPTVGARERWERMYADIREKLFPQMRPDARESVTAHFERALADDAMFAYTPVLIHGDFGASNILYNARARTISGIIDWSSAGLGDPATDLAALICPVSYGEAFAPRLTSVYPGMDDLLARAHFYIGTFALQEALFGAEHDDAGALTRGLADYV